ncbi:WD40 repeat domain-containing protein [Sphingomonas sp.]|jgi:WD40 repeat protein|uniref:WD40 repeat domain-containing protein n=1 Tax=Sphingomonas sp. TaxID=28214 RepID=UPI002E341E6F|nr:WD40 repeat domain-containing protein [Sphingomonas sp.]HEX4693485.1 WD40 repeat domain-containing protein [Sphingomonas sp.]
MRKLIWAFGGIALVLVAARLVLGAEPMQPVPAASGPRIEARFVRMIAKSPKPVRAVSFDAAGSTLAVTGVDGRIRLLSVPGGQAIREFAHPGGATAIDRSPDGRSIATVGYDGTLRLWDLASGAGRVVKVSAQPLWALRFSPDGKSLAVAGEDKLIHLMTADGTPLRTLTGHQRNVWDLAFSSDGQTLASGSFDHTLKIWDVASGRLVRAVGHHDQAIVGVDVRRGDGMIATGGDDATLRLWRSNGDPVRTLAAGQFVDAVAFSADGQWLASGGRESHGIDAAIKAVIGRHPFGGSNPTARIWRVADGALVAALDRQPDDVVAVGFSPDGCWLATGSEDGSVALWRLQPVAR